jgi:aldehyde:ferredoxin oxidoreductase
LVTAIPGTRVGHAPEYETIGAFGSMCECDRIEIIAQCNELCNDFGDMLVEVKGVEIPMHNPRAFWSNALNYAVANRGACHMEGVTFTAESGLPYPDLGYTAPMDPYVADGKAELNVKLHDLMVVYDGLGVCKFHIVVAYGTTSGPWTRRRWSGCWRSTTRCAAGTEAVSPPGSGGRPCSWASFPKAQPASRVFRNAGCLLAGAMSGGLAAPARD